MLVRKTVGDTYNEAIITVMANNWECAVYIAVGSGILEKQAAPRHVCDMDSHCHLGVKCKHEDVDNIAKWILGNDQLNRPGFFSLMSTNHVDISIVESIVRTLDDAKSTAVFPYYGVHPWYSHLFSDGQAEKEAHYASVLVPPPGPELLAVLPDPIDINHHLNRTWRDCGVGEIGLDKAFRIPNNGFYGNQAIEMTGEKLLSCRVAISHQTVILRKQLAIAEKHRLPVSLHCVKAHGALFVLVSQFDLPKLVLHSYSGSVDQARVWIRRFPHICFSFSDWINGKQDTLHALLQRLQSHQVLVETDFSIDSFVGKTEAYLEHLQSIINRLETPTPTILSNQQRLLH